MRLIYIARQCPRRAPHATGNRQRGMALVFTLLLLFLMTALSLGMVIAMSSQTFIAGYYRNYRGAFYAADSGLNIARLSMLNQVLADVPATFTAGTAPIPAAAPAAIQTNVAAAYNSWISIDSGQAANSWPEQFEISSATFSQAACTVSWTGSGAGYTCTALPPSPNVVTSFQYTYSYAITALGRVQNTGQNSVTESGTFTVNVAVGAPTAATTSFAAWGMFIDQANECDGTTLVGGTISGPVFTNGGFTFASGSPYIFTDAVGFASTTAGYSFTNGAGCLAAAASQDSAMSGQNAQTISPTFQAGLSLGQHTVPLPANDFSQKWAVIDGKGIGEGSSAPTSAQLNASMASVTGAAYPATGASTGVYLPYTSTTSSTCAKAPCMTGGGIYVEGSATAVQLTASTGTASHPLQVFTITQGSTVTTITEDLTAQTTTMQCCTASSPSTTKVINGLPDNYNNTTPTPATMLYVDGSIGSGSTGLSGPGQGVAAIQNNAAITITAASNIDITGDILYKTEPVTTTANQIVSGTSPACCNGDAADTLIPLSTTSSTQVLGIFTATGNVNLVNQQSNGNLEIDGSVATISAGGSGGIINTGSAINTLTIVGGRIQNTIQNINSTTRNVFFDRRFSQGAFAPPWFPSTSVTPSGVAGANVLNYKVQRLQWLNNTATEN